MTTVLSLAATAAIIVCFTYILGMYLEGRSDPQKPHGAASNLFFVFLIPCLNEDRVIGATLDQLRAIAGHNSLILVADLPQSVRASLDSQFRKPVLVMRDSTERPEGVLAGTARLVGTSPAEIINSVETLLREPDAYQAMAKSVNPYGDGRAARRTVEALTFFLEQGPAPSDFEPAKAWPEVQAWEDRSSLGLPAAAS